MPSEVPSEDDARHVTTFENGDATWSSKSSQNKSNKIQYKHVHEVLQDSWRDDGIRVDANDKPHPASPQEKSTGGLSRTEDDGMDSLHPPSRSISHVLEQPIEECDNKEALKRSQSFIQSLPVAKAEPETRRMGSILAFTSQVEFVTDSDRLVKDKTREQELDRRRPSLISVRIFKPVADVKLGVGFRSVSGELQVGNIAQISPLASSPLRQGDRLICLDDHRNTNHWTAIQAANYVRNKEGLICFVVRTKNGNSNVAEAAVYKSFTEEKVGISFKSDKGRLRISKIDSQGLLGEMAVLQSGDYVETINGIDVSEVAPSLALQIVKSTVGMITFRVKHENTCELSVRDVELTNLSSRELSGSIVAMADELANLDYMETGFLCANGSELHIRPGFVSVTVYKPTIDTKLGISFRNPEGDQLQISYVATQGLLAKSPLAAGQLIQSISGVRCRRWTKERTLESIKEALGEITFVLRDPAGDFSYAVAMAYKPTPRATLGICFKTMGGPLKVGNINPDGLLSNTVLNCNDTLISINNIPCQCITPLEAVYITQRNPESVVLLTKPHHSNGIVLSHISDSTGEDEYELALQQDLEAQHGHQLSSGNSKFKSYQFLGLFLCMFFAGLILVVVMLRGT